MSGTPPPERISGNGCGGGPNSSPRVLLTVRLGHGFRNVRYLTESVGGAAWRRGGTAGISGAAVTLEEMCADSFSPHVTQK